MWTTPPLEELKTTLEDPTSPIGKRMRAAYYAKQRFLDAKTNNRGTNNNENNDDNDGADDDAQKIVGLLCTQVFNIQHGSLLRHEFAYVLGQMQTTLACQSLHQLLEATNDCVMVRHEAAEALGAIASPQSIDILQRTYEQYEGSLNELADTCRLALLRIQNPNDNNVGCACMMAPYSSVDPVAADPLHAQLTAEELGDILCNESLDLVDRYRAMFSLRNRGGAGAGVGEDSVRQLCRALIMDRSSPLLRHEVAFVLGQLQHPSSIDSLELSLSRKDEHVMVRHESAEALGAIDVQDSQQWQRIESILMKYQKDDVLAVAESCIVALDAADYWGHVIGTDDDDDERVRVSSNSEEKKDYETPVASTSFGQQKRMDEKGGLNAKDMLALHFNVDIQK